MDLRIAQTDTEIARCFPVMVQLHPHLREDEFVSRIRHLMKTGYSLVYLEDAETVRAIAGFRLVKMLSPELFLVVDDMVTNASVRSQGYGDALFEWLTTYARQHSCRQIHLDSSVRFVEAHRFYFRKRMHIQGYHFILPLDE